MKKTIIQIIADSSISGGPSHVLDLCQNLNKNKFNIAIVCPPGPMVKNFKTAKAAVYEIPIKSAFDPNAILQIKEIILKEKAKNPNLIVHAHGTRAGFLAEKAIKNLNVKLIYTEHLWTKDYHLKNPLREKLQLFALKNLCRHADKIIAVSNAVKEFLTDKKIVNPTKIEIIYNGIKVNYRKKNKSNKKIIVGSIGALNSQKGYQYLIKAAKKVLYEIKDVQFEIVGEGPLLQNLKLQVSNLKSNFKFLSNIENLDEKIASWYLYIQPSLSESFGLSILKSMAQGLPVVAFSVGAIPELVVQNVTGILVQPRNSQQLAQAIIKIIKNSHLREEMSQAAREQAQKFQLTEMIKKTEKLYEKIS